MDIYRYCKECESNRITGQKCDTCGKSTEQGEFVPIIINFSYGHDLDGTSYDFCSYECVLNFIWNEIKKHKPDNLLYGGTNV